MVERGNLVAVEADGDRLNMVVVVALVVEVDVSHRADVVPCVKIMAQVVVFNAPIHGVVHVLGCSPGRPCDIPDHRGGKLEYLINIKWKI